MYNVQELATAALHNIPLVSIVFEDGMLQNVKRMQSENFSGHHIAVELKNPDFVSLAESFGVEARRARTPAELREALKAGFAAGRPYLIHVPVGEMPSPWKILHLPKVRGLRR
jgi:acetolactate synthase-1/2/3 large subunit